MVVICPREDSGIQVNVYALISIADNCYRPLSQFHSEFQSWEDSSHKQEEIENEDCWLDGKTEQKLAWREVRAELSESRVAVAKLLSPQSREKLQLGLLKLPCSTLAQRGGESSISEFRRHRSGCSFGDSPTPKEISNRMEPPSYGLGNIT